MSDKSKIYDYIKRTINPYGKPFEGTAYELGLKIMDYIENMDDEKENGWIPVSERLPEETGEYLVWYDCGDEKGCMVVNFDAGIGSFGDWYDDYDNITLGFVDSEFIYFETAVAWMPLSEPYKEDEP